MSRSDCVSLCVYLFYHLRFSLHLTVTSTVSHAITFCEPPSHSNTRLSSDHSTVKQQKVLKAARSAAVSLGFVLGA